MFVSLFIHYNVSESLNINVITEAYGNPKVLALYIFYIFPLFYFSFDYNLIYCPHPPLTTVYVALLHVMESTNYFKC